jgi:hypothetical protein
MGVLTVVYRIVVCLIFPPPLSYFTMGAGGSRARAATQVGAAVKRSLEEVPLPSSSPAVSTPAPAAAAAAAATSVAVPKEKPATPTPEPPQAPSGEQAASPAKSKDEMLLQNMKSLYVNSTEVRSGRTCFLGVR